ncbi:uncharacterized protein SPSC_05565 [Sporisorium scitamineum]|uniref:Uncharacterized protein n=1 Tax=Sporisorium scitamineum TaxID=49012 RepID=A0A127Z6D8_9BASI|nr:uncharacterized protein SPSC_05565 [Sporisorium scitamineum]
MSMALRGGQSHVADRLDPDDEQGGLQDTPNYCTCLVVLWTCVNLRGRLSVIRDASPCVGGLASIVGRRWRLQAQIAKIMRMIDKLGDLHVDRVPGSAREVAKAGGFKLRRAVRASSRAGSKW